RGALPAPGPPVQRGAALGRARPGSRPLGQARADRPRGGRAEPDLAAVGVPLPPPLPVRHRDLLGRGAAADRARPRPPGGLPPPVERVRDAGGGRRRIGVVRRRAPALLVAVAVAAGCSGGHAETFSTPLQPAADAPSAATRAAVRYF